MQVATAYATNCDDVERTLFIKETPPPPTPVGEQERKPEEPSVEADQPDPGVRASDANTGQLSHKARADLLKVLQEYNDKGLFPKNPKVVRLQRGRKVPISLIDEDVTPVACKQQSMSPIHEEIVNDQVDLWRDAGFVSYSTSWWCHRITLIPKNNGEMRLWVDYRELNKLTKKDSGGLGTLAMMHHETKGSKIFTVIDLASAYHQLPIKQSDRHKRASRDGRGRL